MSYGFFVVVVFLLDASEFPLFLLEPWVFASRWGVFQWGGRYLVCQVYFIFMVLGDFFRGDLSSPCCCGEWYCGVGSYFHHGVGGACFIGGCGS